MFNVSANRDRQFSFFRLLEVFLVLLSQDPCFQRLFPFTLVSSQVILIEENCDFIVPPEIL